MIVVAIVVTIIFFLVMAVLALFAWAGGSCAEDDDHAYKDAIGDYPTLPKERKP